jgi:hypothetical protein
MRGRYLEVTFRTGRPAYLYLPRRGAEHATRVSKAAPGLLIDCTPEGKPIGIEITAPGRVSLPAAYRWCLVKRSLPRAAARRPLAARNGTPRAVGRGGDRRCVRRVGAAWRAVHPDGGPACAPVRDQRARCTGDGRANRFDRGQRGDRDLPPWATATADCHPRPPATQPASRWRGVDRGIPVLGTRTVSTER